MDPFLRRSNSTHISSATRRPKPHNPPPAAPATSATPKRSHIPTTSRPAACGAFSSPADSPRPPRPKSTLGFSSKFALSWKNSLKSSTSARSTLAKAADGTPGDLSKSSMTGVGSIGTGAKEGGMQRLRRKVSTEWWTSSSAASIRPSTPALADEVSSSRNSGVTRRPRPRSWGMSPFTPLSMTPHPTADNTPSANPPFRPPASTRLYPINHRTASRQPGEDLAAEPETPVTQAVHAEWRVAAMDLEGDWRLCLFGAVCLSISDPLEGIKDEYMKFFSPRCTPIPKLVPSSTTTTPTSTPPKSDPASARSGFRSPTTGSLVKSNTPHIPSAAPTFTTSRLSQSTLAMRKHKPTLHLPASPSPSPASRARPSVSPTPLTRRPLASRRTVNPALGGDSASVSGNSAPSGHSQSASSITLRRDTNVGVTPRSARRMRNSLKMTPMPTAGSRLPLPVAYVPLKAPSGSPTVSPAVNRPISSSRTFAIDTSSPSASRQSSLQSVITGSTDRSRFGFGSSMIPITPPRRPQEDEAMSPWAVVGPSPAFAKRHEGVSADTDWVMASPLRRSMR